MDPLRRFARATACAATLAVAASLVALLLPAATPPFPVEPERPRASLASAAHPGPERVALAPPAPEPPPPAEPVVEPAVHVDAPADATAGPPAADDGLLELVEGSRIESSPFVGARGQTLAGEVLGFDPADEEGDAEPFEVELDVQGRPRLDLLPPGRWTLHLLEPTGTRDELRGWVLEVEAVPGQPVTLAFDASGPRGAVTGAVRGPPPGEFVQVELRPARPPHERFAFIAARATAPDGSFAFDAVPPGAYRVLAAWEGGEAHGAVEVQLGAPARVELGP